MMSGLKSLIDKILPRGKRQDSTPAAQIFSQKTPISPDKQKQLGILCEQLFQKKELITSGKLQFIGLAKLKTRMGKSWAGLCRIVYDTTEEVINKYISKGDIFIRFKDDAYLIIFAHASREEGEIRATMIANEIKERLYGMNRKELQDIEVRKAIGEISTKTLVNKSLPDTLEIIDHASDAPAPPKPRSEQKEPQFDITKLDYKAVEVEPESYAGTSTAAPQKELIDCMFLPLWEVQKNALTTYLCLPSGNPDELFNSYKNFCRTNPYSAKVSLDIKILESVIETLDHMEKSGRKLFLACPIQYETLNRKESYEKTAVLIQHIPSEQKKYLVLVVMDMPTSSRNFSGVVGLLKKHCRGIFAEFPLQQDINFSEMKNTGVDAIGISLDSKMPEQTTIAKLNSFVSRTKAAGLHSFVLNMPSLSLTTSAVCAGFNYLGGSAIHDPVREPDNVHRYRHEDLFVEIIKANNS